jgi:hypothetical protein
MALFTAIEASCSQKDSVSFPSSHAKSVNRGRRKSLARAERKEFWKSWEWTAKTKKDDATIHVYMKSGLE